MTDHINNQDNLQNGSQKAGSYKVLARKYRPLSFKNLVGQEALVTTLATGLKLNKIVHGYLLSGIRGVGKTTTARIIARTINCTNLQYNDSGAPEPCFNCANCNEIDKEAHPDLIEIDAASKTGVADIRELIENSRYRPMLGRYKVYIIDEVHMLSLSAFNALLKTLEEPPQHVIFILATTEVRKIPVTIMSRCQKFQLRRLNKEEIIQHLINISAKEKILIAKEGLEIIAEKSEGSVRDSLSLLDQVIISWQDQGQEIDLKFVLNILGIADKKSIFELFKFILDGKIAKAHQIIQDIYYQGVQLHYAFDELAEMLADLLKAKTTGEIHTPSYINREYQEFMMDSSSKTSAQSLLYLWQILVKGRTEMQKSSNPLSTCEILIIKACHICGLLGSEETEEGEKTLSPSRPVEPMRETRIQKIEPEVPKVATPIKDVQSAVIEIDSAVNIVELVPAQTQAVPLVADYKAFTEIFRASSEMIIYHALCHDFIPLAFDGSILRLGGRESFSKSILNEIVTTYKKLTSIDISIDFTIVMEGQTLGQRREEEKQQKIAEISTNSDVQKVLGMFQDAKIVAVE